MPTRFKKLKTVGVQTDLCNPVQILTAKIKLLQRKSLSEQTALQRTITELKNHTQELQLFVTLFFLGKNYDDEDDALVLTDEPEERSLLLQIARVKEDVKAAKGLRCKLLKELSRPFEERKKPQQIGTQKSKIVKYKWDRCLEDFIEEEDLELEETGTTKTSIFSSSDSNKDQDSPTDFANTIMNLMIRNTTTTKQVERSLNKCA